MPARTRTHYGGLIRAIAMTYQTSHFYRHILLWALVSVGVLCCVAQEPALTQSADTSAICIEADSVAKPRKGFFNRIIDYFNDSNKPKEYKGFDFSIVGGPHYSSDTRLGVGLVAAGFYRNDLTDSITMPSNVSLYGDVSTVGFYMVGVNGNHIFRGDRNRIEYGLYFYSFPRKFWGIGYEAGNDINHSTKFNEKFVEARVKYLHAIAPHLYIGPGAEFHYTHAGKLREPSYWDGLALHSTTYTAGVSVRYDSRDNLTATERGVMVSFEQRFSPKFMGNRQAYSSTEVAAAGYKNVWRGGVLAARLHGVWNFGNVPWPLMATFGGSNSMRGYYQGRYRDKCALDFTIELRQHVWRRNGIVVWGGVGSVFPKMSAMRFDRLLPNGGVGYRWEFKKRTNVRLDFGIARRETAFIFSINEAF